MKRITPIFTLCLLLLSACILEQPVITSQTPLATGPGFSEAFNRLATQTQAAVLTTSAESQRVAPTLERMTAYTPSPLPSLPPLLDKVGPFQQVSRQEAPIIGKVVNLQTLRDGSLLLLSESGYGKFKYDQWTAYFIGETGYLVGVDPEGQGWAVTYDGSRISRWESRTDDMEIWISYSENEGWSTPKGSIGNPVSPILYTDSSRNLWVTTATDVRRFDGARWEVFDTQALGMQPLSDGISASFTILPVPRSNQVYVGRCDWGSAGISGGGGLRAFDGGAWTLPEPGLETGCITAITQDQTGNIWIARDASLYRYDPSKASLDEVSLPQPSSPSHFGYITALTPAPDGSLWAQLALCEDAACLGETALFHLKDGYWQMIGEPGQRGGQKLFFDAVRNTWVLAAGSFSEVVGNNLQAIPGLAVLAATSDPSGRLWLVAQSIGPPTLWNQP